MLLAIIVPQLIALYDGNTVRGGSETRTCGIRYIALHRYADITHWETFQLNADIFSKSYVVLRVVSPPWPHKPSSYSGLINVHITVGSTLYASLSPRLFG
jgi:hypothetical protein